jgi:uncharacterized protein (DUF849 family)
MPGHDLSKLEAELRTIQTGTNELLQIIYKKGYTTPREFELVLGAARGIAAQVKTLVSVSKEIVGETREAMA